MVEQVRVPKNVTREQFLEAVRTGVHDAMGERPRVLAAAALLPCLDCRHGAKALEEVAAIYAALACLFVARHMPRAKSRMRMRKHYLESY